MSRVYPRRRVRFNAPRGVALTLGLVLAGLGLDAGFSAAAAGSDLYRHVDSRGVVHFSDVSREGYRKVPKPRGATYSKPNQSRARGVPIRRYDRLIAHASEEAGIPPALVKAVIHAESAFNPSAVSPKGAMGLMQLMPETAESLGVDDAFRAEQNVRGGTRYLRDLHQRFGSWTITLAAYNAGPGAVDRYRGVPPYRETREYVRRVLSYYRRYHGDFPR